MPTWLLTKEPTMTDPQSADASEAPRSGAVTVNGHTYAPAGR